MAKLFEIEDYVITIVVALFLFFAFDDTIGTAYGLIILADLILFYINIDSKAHKFIPVEKPNNNRFYSLMWAVTAYVIFIFFSNYLRLQLGPQAVDQSAFEAIPSIFASIFATTPILYGSTYLKLAVWGILIPFVETRAFFRTFYQWFLDLANVSSPKDIFSLSAQISALAVGILFALFHIGALGITNNEALIVSAVFGYVSILMIIYFGQVIEALFLHVINNTIATMSLLSIGFFALGSGDYTGILILAGSITATWILVFQDLPINFGKVIG